jgi:pyruvate/2-oxoglutarate dehydrogenase complex dihydrolipoamide dehydrogenase (E3) component
MAANGDAANGEFEFDLVTIGAGSGGVRASRVAAATYGAKVGGGRPAGWADRAVAGHSM